jgi:hypothetical protein
VRSASEFSFAATGDKSKKKENVTRLQVGGQKQLSVGAGKSTRVYIPALVAQAFLKIPVTLTAKVRGRGRGRSTSLSKRLLCLSA